MGTDPVIAQVITDDMQLLLDRAFCDGEYDLRASDSVTQAVILNVLLKHQRDSEDPALSCLLLHHSRPPFDENQAVVFLLLHSYCYRLDQ